MIEIKKFTETEIEFREITRIYNLVSHDDITHIDEEKENWELLDKSRVCDRLLLYYNDTIIGFLRYLQGRNSLHRLKIKYTTIGRK